MPKTASVVSFASSKGGPGKTTALIVIGDALAAVGKRIVMLDADPNGHLFAWSTLISAPTPNLRVVGRITEEDILDRIREEGRGADLVLVDLEGTANNALTYATSKSDLVVIPAQASAMDLQEAFRAIALLDRASKVIERAIPHRVLLSKMPVLATRAGRHAREQLERQGAQVFHTELMERTIFKEMTFHGRTPRETDPTGNAAANVAALTQELIRALPQKPT
jgi:chromosome partitioning protein